MWQDIKEELERGLFDLRHKHIIGLPDKLDYLTFYEYSKTFPNVVDLTLSMKSVHYKELSSIRGGAKISASSMWTSIGRSYQMITYRSSKMKDQIYGVPDKRLMIYLSTNSTYDVEAIDKSEPYLLRQDPVVFWLDKDSRSNTLVR